MNKKLWGICIGILGIAIVAVTVFKIPLGSLAIAGTFLLCPLLHFWMMRSGEHKH